MFLYVHVIRVCLPGQSALEKHNKITCLPCLIIIQSCYRINKSFTQGLWRNVFIASQCCRCFPRDGTQVNWRPLILFLAGDKGRTGPRSECLPRPVACWQSVSTWEIYEHKLRTPLTSFSSCFSSLYCRWFPSNWDSMTSLTHTVLHNRRHMVRSRYGREKF